MLLNSGSSGGNKSLKFKENRKWVNKKLAIVKRQDVVEMDAMELLNFIDQEVALVILTHRAKHVLVQNYIAQTVDGRKKNEKN
jgi:hypothetical protein